MRELTIVIGLAALGYAGLALYVWYFQDRFVYYPGEPGRELDATPAHLGIVYEDVFLDTADGETLHGWFVPGDGEGVILFFHGNAGNISHRLDSIALFHRLEQSVLIVDYRGYGRSTGHPDETGTYRDAQAAWDYLTIERSVDPQQIVIFGRSLGGAVAGWLATRVTPRGLVLEATFTSIRDMARHAFPWLPTQLARIRYDTEKRLASVTCPILILHSPDDDVIPFAMSERLRAAAAGPVRLEQLRGGHNDAATASGKPYVDTLRRFLAETL